MRTPRVAPACSIAVLCTLLSLCPARTGCVFAQTDTLPVVSNAGQFTGVDTSGARPSSPATADARAAAVHAQLSFDIFTRMWMQKLMATEQFQRNQRLLVTKTEDGFMAEYVGYLPERKTTVKATTSPVTPFIGILRYYKKRMRSVGKTRQQAMRGPFEQVRTSPVAEIFPYTKGEWSY